MYVCSPHIFVGRFLWVFLSYCGDGWVLGWWCAVGGAGIVTEEAWWMGGAGWDGIGGEG